MVSMADCWQEGLSRLMLKVYPGSCRCTMIAHTDLVGFQVFGLVRGWSLLVQISGVQESRFEQQVQLHLCK